MTVRTHETKASIEQHIPALRRYARSLTRNPDDAEDVLQTCLERALRRFHQFQRGTNLRGWLFTIMHNEFVSGIRRQQRRGISVPVEEWRGDLGVEGRQEDAIRMRDLTRAFGALSRRDRQILYMIGVEGRTYKGTAEKLDVETGTVKSRLFRARERLRENLEGSGGALHA
jgi:RNA polymerase sigma-70 factor (ECF subfamily)